MLVDACPSELPNRHDTVLPPRDHRNPTIGRGA
jgi:hypothetical protein